MQVVEDCLGPEVNDLFAFQDEAEALCIQVKHKRPAPMLAVGPVVLGARA
jgi:hypothetical protein